MHDRIGIIYEGMLKHHKVSLKTQFKQECANYGICKSTINALCEDTFNEHVDWFVGQLKNDNEFMLSENKSNSIQERLPQVSSILSWVSNNEINLNTHTWDTAVAEATNHKTPVKDNFESFFNFH